MEIATIVLSIAVFFFILKWLNGSRIPRLLNKIPGPPTVPIFGNLLSALVPREKMFGVLVNWDYIYGPIYRTWAGPMYPNVHIQKAHLVEQILSSAKYIKKAHMYEFLHPWLGTGLLTSDGKKWFKHRKMITPTFHFQVLDNFIDVFNENCKILVKKLHEKAGDGKVFDIYPYITHCALDIICESSMGTKVHAQEEEHSDYVTSLYRLIELSVKRAIELWSHFNLIFYMTAAGREYKRVLNVVHGFTRKVIKERIEIRKRQGTIHEEVSEVGRKKRKAFLDLLLDVAESESLKLTQDEIREEVDTFMFEGHDTTTAAICWSLFMLGHHKDIQDQVYEEQKKIFEEDPNRPITMKDLSEMKLLERVIKEALRLYPSVPVIARELQEDTVVGEYTVPKGVAVVINSFTLHRDPEMFPDPESFNPDRFLPDEIQKRHPYAYIPFSAGPRNCIGQKFALLEEKTVLATLVRNFVFQSVEKKGDVIPVFELILRPAYGVKVKISRREQ